MILPASLCACVRQSLRRFCVSDRLTTIATGRPTRFACSQSHSHGRNPSDETWDQQGNRWFPFRAPTKQEGTALAHRRERDNFGDRTNLYVRSASAVRNAPSYAKLVNHGTYLQTLSAPGTRAESSSMPKTGWYAGTSSVLGGVTALSTVFSRSARKQATPGTGNRISTIKSTRTHTTLPRRRLCRRCPEGPIHLHSTQSSVYRTKL